MSLGYFDSSNSLFDLLVHEVFLFHDAERVALELVKLEGVIAAELYGSISRNGSGRDLDLLIVVESEFLYQRFVAQTLCNIRDDFEGICGGADLRRLAVYSIWQEQWPDWEECLAHRNDVGSFLDMFVVPVNWRERLDELQGNLPHDDPCFMQHIACDARVIAAR